MQISTNLSTQFTQNLSELHDKSKVQQPKQETVNLKDGFTHSPTVEAQPDFKAISAASRSEKPFVGSKIESMLRSTSPDGMNRVVDQKFIDQLKATHADWPIINFTYDASQAEHLTNLQLTGSFNPETGAYDPEWNQGVGVAMHDDGKNGDAVAGDGIYTASVVLNPEHQGEFQWGIKTDMKDSSGKVVKKNQWAIMTEEPPAFSINMKEAGKPQQESYSPTTLHRMGVHKSGEDGITFRTWAPATGSASLPNISMFVDIYDEKGEKVIKSLPMVKDETTGNWTAASETGWKELEGKPYQYSMRSTIDSSTANSISYSDPYARFLQGQQRGLERIFVDPVLGVETGWYNDSGSGGPDYTVNPNWGRFTVNDNLDADKVVLVFKDENGHQLSKKELMDRLGEPKLIPYEKATEAQKRNADILNAWQIDTSGKVTDYKWSDNVGDDGAIQMHKVGGENVTGGWVSTVNNFPALEGLTYEFEVYKDGKLLGDKNNDGILQPAEREALAFNDPYSSKISAKPGSERMSVIQESNYKFRYNDVPRKETDHNKYTIYEAHVGSFRTTPDNAVPTKFSDMIKYLDYVESLGYNSVEIMPFNEFGGKRDWGYTPDFYFAGAEAYAFEMPRAEAVERGLIRKDQDTDKESVWIKGSDAVKLFVDEAHKKGLNVICDVVYNHTSGKTDGENPLWSIDGKQNSFFKWPSGNHSFTPWGAKPNYAAQGVKNFFADNALQQVKEFGVDGIRFDFAQVLHSTGDSFEQKEGMDTLRQINRTLAFFSPDGKPLTVAEDFTQNWLVAADLDKSQWQDGMEKKGMGFDGVWNGPVHHDLIGAIEGKKNMDQLIDTLLSHRGVDSPQKAVVFSHTHDEVGNSGTWTYRSAAKSEDPDKVMQNYPRAIGRTAAAIIHTMPGIPMVFQGEEFIANNDFKHGATATWGADYSWMDFRVDPAKLAHFKEIAAMPEAEQQKEMKKLGADQEYCKKYLAMTSEEKKNAEIYSLKSGQAEVYKALNELRASSNAFNADAQMQRIYTHNDDKVMAYERTDGKDTYVVVVNLSDRDYTGYAMNGMPAGNWKQVFNSDEVRFGGTGKGSVSGNISAGHVPGDLPAGTTIIFKKV